MEDAKRISTILNFLYVKIKKQEIKFSPTMKNNDGCKENSIFILGIEKI